MIMARLRPPKSIRAKGADSSGRRRSSLWIVWAAAVDRLPPAAVDASPPCRNPPLPPPLDRCHPPRPSVNPPRNRRLSPARTRRNVFPPRHSVRLGSSLATPKPPQKPSHRRSPIPAERNAAVPALPHNHRRIPLPAERNAAVPDPPHNYRRIPAPTEGSAAVPDPLRIRRRIPTPTQPNTAVRDPSRNRRRIPAPAERNAPLPHALIGWACFAWGDEPAKLPGGWGGLAHPHRSSPPQVRRGPAQSKFTQSRPRIFSANSRTDQPSHGSNRHPRSTKMINACLRPPMSILATRTDRTGRSTASLWTTRDATNGIPIGPRSPPRTQRERCRRREGGGWQRSNDDRCLRPPTSILPTATDNFARRRSRPGTTRGDPVVTLSGVSPLRGITNPLLP
ncbi:hypothetical protein CLV40_10179 [Actinokineospora auranticolor]|uniref:Uncharacterized protein n=1 Tax=Actinokineospora auranticolor TaxID=155976 RepID=A0A2S6H092_9PSEU|nr:hypothetical protein CLV40_10179 [Actinokineospora auranticolor]